MFAGVVSNGEGVPLYEDSSMNGWRLETMTILCLILACVVSASASEQQIAAGDARDSAAVHVIVAVSADRTQAVLPHARELTSARFHVLVRTPEAAAEWRSRIDAAGLHGRVLAVLWDGRRLPYPARFVNVLRVGSARPPDPAECRRVLTPHGLLIVARAHGWSPDGLEPMKSAAEEGSAVFRKAWPTILDQWGHRLRGPDNNAVSRDREVGPPRRLQWIADPRWSRCHEDLASVSAVVTANGRLFAIVDTAPVASNLFPAEWRLVARDAWNGFPLWERSMADWMDHRHTFRSGPANLSRRLVAVGDRVFAPLGWRAPISCLDAVTGKTLREYDETADAVEFLVDDGRLYAVVGNKDDKSTPFNPESCRILCIRVADGQVDWQLSPKRTAGLLPLSLAVSGGRVIYQTGRELVAVAADDGKELWRTPVETSNRRPNWWGATVVAQEDIIFSATRSPSDRKEPASVQVDMGPNQAYKTGGTRLSAHSASDGALLWTASAHEGFGAPADVFVFEDAVAVRINKNVSGPYVLLDRRTGKKVREIEGVKAGFHGRCHRHVATLRHIIASPYGLAYLPVDGGEVLRHPWTRGGCQYGVIGANGLTYVTPHPCGCNPHELLTGFRAYAASEPEAEQPTAVGAPEQSTEPPVAVSRTVRATAQDWPCYRANGARDASCATRLGPGLAEAWRRSFRSPCSQVVVLGDLACVAIPGEGAVEGLDPRTGARRWRSLAGGAVDTPPTLHAGMVLFGCRDGRLYALRASDGRPVWSRRLAPRDRFIGERGALASAWPVPGCVLVHDGAVYAAAGRSSHLDGGIHLYRLDPATGRTLGHFVCDGAGGIGARAEILSCQDGALFMGPRRIDAATLEVSPEAGPHLYAFGSLRDDTWFHRTLWTYAPPAGRRAKWSRAGMPSGRLLSRDGARIYGFGRSSVPGHRKTMWKGRHYRIYAADRDVKPPTESKAGGRKKWRYPLRWEERVNFEARAFVLTADALAAAGPLGDTVRSVDAYRGKEGSVLVRYDPETGAESARLPLGAVPVFDGLSAANGTLFLALRDGTLLAFNGAAGRATPAGGDGSKT